MWLLSTDRAELHFFMSPENVEGGYAILSHVWGRNEQSFADVQKTREHCLRTGANPRDYVSEKIRQCCILAERHGYRWIWNDTCCIDKTSSAELSEAINSMYKYYSLAEVCYAYLADVPATCDLYSQQSEFRHSRWHKRGWTLQELVAPRFLVFLSGDWTAILGTKSELASLVEEISCVPARVLQFEAPCSSVSVAGRMSWAAKRATTRVEDEAYSLMGIFGINMPTLYGEGREAFRRLQEEIMKQSIDTSLFAWGSSTMYIPPTLSEEHLHVGDDSYLLAKAPSDFNLLKNPASVPYFTPPQGVGTGIQSITNMVRPDIPYLAVERLNSMRQIRSSLKELLAGRFPTKAGPPLQVGIPTFSITPYGIHARVPIFEVSGYTIAILFCSNGTQTLGLFLTPCPNSPDPFRPLYHVGISNGRIDTVTRLVMLGEEIDLLHLGVTPKLHWTELYIEHRPVTGATGGSNFPLVVNGWVSSPFRFSEQNVRHLLQAAHFKLVERTTRVPPMPWNGSPPASFVFEYTWARLIDLFAEECGFVLRLGRCVASNASEREGLQAHWANLQFYTSSPAAGSDPLDLDAHSCPADHIAQWVNQTKTFKVPWDIVGHEEHTLESLLTFSHYDIVLTFSPFVLRSDAMVVNISLRRVDRTESSLDISLIEHPAAPASSDLRRVQPNVVPNTVEHECPAQSKRLIPPRCYCQ